MDDVGGVALLLDDVVGSALLAILLDRQDRHSLLLRLVQHHGHAAIGNSWGERRDTHTHARTRFTMYLCMS